MREQFAWAAGIIDGEGTIYIAHSRNKYLRIDGGVTFYRQARLRIGAPQYSDFDSPPEMLSRLFNLFGGNLNGPYGPYTKAKYTKKKQFMWAVTGFEGVQNVLCHIWPWLGAIKKEQAAIVVKEWLAGDRGPVTLKD